MKQTMNKTALRRGPAETLMRLAIFGALVVLELGAAACGGSPTSPGDAAIDDHAVQPPITDAVADGDATQDGGQANENAVSRDGASEEGTGPKTDVTAHDADQRTRLHALLYLPFEKGSTWDRSGTGNDAYLYRGSFVNSCPGLNKPCYRFEDKWTTLVYAPMEIPFRHSLTFGINDDYTVMLWVKNNNLNSYGDLVNAPRIGDAYAYRLYILKDGRYRFCAHDGTTTSCAVAKAAHPGAWNLVVGSKRGASICIRINKESPVCSAYTLTKTTRAVEGRLEIAQHPTGGREFVFEGWMSSLAIFGRALGNGEIEDIVDGKAIIGTCDLGDAKCCGNGVCDAGEDVGTCISDCADGYWETTFLREYFRYQRRYDMAHGMSGYTYWMNIKIRPFLNMYEKTKKLFYLEKGLENAEYAVRQMTDVESDGGHREWGCQGEDAVYCCDHDGKPSTPDISYPLGAERAGREITRLARVIVKSPSLSSYRARALMLAKAMEDNLVNHPAYEARFKYPGTDTPFCKIKLVPVHHIVSHQATVLRNLYEITQNPSHKAVYKTVFLAKAKSLLDSTFPNPGGHGVIWGQANCKKIIYTYPKCYVGFDTIVSKCTDGAGNGYCFPMDIAHSTDYVDMVVEFYKAGYVFKKPYIDSLVETVKQVLLKKDAVTGQYYFKTHLDGRDQPPQGNPKVPSASYSAMPTSYVRSVITPGWMSLAEFDSSLKKAFASMKKNTGDYRIYPTFRLNYYSDMARVGAPLP